jgi:hypothetical protein
MIYLKKCYFTLLLEPPLEFKVILIELGYSVYHFLQYAGTHVHI